MSSIFSFLGGPFAGVIDKIGTGAVGSILQPIAKFMDDLIIPFTIIVAIIGAGWIIWLGVKLARAENDSDATTAKKNLIRVAIAVVAVIVLIWLLTWVASSLSGWIGESASNPFTSSSAS